MRAPVIAAVNGTAAGAGVGLVCAADLAVCARASRFSLAYTGVGLAPDGSVSFLLPRIVGRRRAMELLLLNRVLSAEEALAWGLVNQVIDDADLAAQAQALAAKLAAGPTESFGATKRLHGRVLARSRVADGARGPDDRGDVDASARPRRDRGLHREAPGEISVRFAGRAGEPT